MNIALSNISFHHAYQISLKNTSGTQALPELEFKAFIDHLTIPVQYRCTKLEEATFTADTLYKARFDSIFADVDGFKEILDLNIVCLFIPCTGLSLNVEAKSGE